MSKHIDVGSHNLREEVRRKRLGWYKLVHTTDQRTHWHRFGANEVRGDYCEYFVKF